MPKAARTSTAPRSCSCGGLWRLARFEVARRVPVSASVSALPSPLARVCAAGSSAHDGSDAGRRRARRLQRPVAGTCSLHGRPSRQQLQPRGILRRRSSRGLRRCERRVQAEAVQGSSCILRPATKGHAIDRRGVRPRARSRHQRANASKRQRQGLLVRPERASVWRRDAGDVPCRVVR
eukprot:scaffold16128_cov48-Phaeocystis_antarctica.AAC.1